MPKKEDAPIESKEGKSFKLGKIEEHSSQSFENDNKFDFNSEDPADADMESLPEEKELSKQLS